MGIGVLFCCVSTVTQEIKSKTYLHDIADDLVEADAIEVCLKMTPAPTVHFVT